jgi:hypothetical protein
LFGDFNLCRVTKMAWKNFMKVLGSPGEVL